MDDNHGNTDLNSNSSDYIMDDHSSMDNYDQYTYHGEVQDHEEERMTSSEREEDHDYGHSSGNYYDEDESHEEEGQEVFVDEGDEDEAEDDDDVSYDNEDSGGVNDSTVQAQRSQRLFTVQGILGNLAQGLQDGNNAADAGDGSDRLFGPRQGHMNLSEVFPEILSILNDGAQRSEGNGRGRNDRILRLVNNVSNAAEDPYIALESLKEISEHLLMMNQVIIERLFPVEKLLRSIISLLSNPSLKGELELQLMSCRCLYNLFEINPESIYIAVDQNIISVLQDILLEISYIDLAEQVLETLELISRLHPRDILQSGGMSSCLQYLDFFTIHAQRKAVAIVSNACSRVRIEDFDTIQELFVILKPIFVNAMDQIILVKLLNALYGICEALRKKKMLESLFTLDIIERIARLISSPDSQLESKMKCLDIISVLVNISGKISKEFIESCDVINMLSDCFSCYSKGPNAALHETLMFVPKPLLHSIARTIALLFPTENEQVLSMDTPREPDFTYNDEKLDKLLKDLTPLLIEIYVNTVDFDVRRCALVALARVASCLKASAENGVGGDIVRLAGSTLAQNQAILEKEKDQVLVAGGLMVGVLSLLDILTVRFASNVLPTLKREGIYNLVQALHVMLQKRKDEGKIALCNFDANLDRGLMLDRDETIEEEDDEYDLQFGSMDIPDQVKPKKIRFNVLRPLSLDYTYLKMYELSENLLSLFVENEDTVIEELRDIEKLVEYLHATDLKDSSTESWVQLWTTVRNSIFNGNFEISSFEFISTGLASALSRTVEKNGSMSLIPKRTFIEVFGDKLGKVVELLQSALTRLESFRIVECGLQGSEGRVASLGKQIKIKLLYDGDHKMDNIAQQLTTITVSIHCVASFKTLNEFLKHRIAQAKFLNLLLPGTPSSGAYHRDGHIIEEVKNWMLEFSIDEEPLKFSDTIFGAIFRVFKGRGKDPAELWREPQVIKYKRIDGHKAEEGNGIGNIYNHERDFESSLKPADDILNLLRFLKVKELPSDMFVNAKLSAKLSRQLEEPLVVASGVLPSWTLQLTKKYSFLFPLDTRLFFLQCTSFGYGRLIQLWRNKSGNAKESNGDDPLQQLGRITRHKLRISRSTMFLSGLKILGKYGSSPSVLEIEYQDEVGTGLGPTLEFYAFTSREFTKKSLNMWKCDKFGDESVMHESPYITEYLFPAPLDTSKDNRKVLELFRYLGIFVARSMLDNRILDFRFNSLFFELTHRRCRNRGENTSCADMQERLQFLWFVDNQLSKSLKYLHDHRDNESELEQLTLTFTLPGYNIELVENGKKLMVTSDNVEDYVNKVLDYFLGLGVDNQLDRFIDGFSEVFPYTSLLLLNPEELVELYGRVEEDWSSSTLYASINADHGYTMDSATIHELLSIMASFKKEERRLFLQFLTGSPKLPLGGFKSLKPKLTVVLKHPEDGSNPDEYLPSVMTCANYFKLPKYSCEDIMRSRIVQAMNEGSGAFLLS